MRNRLPTSLLIAFLTIGGLLKACVTPRSQEDAPSHRQSFLWEAQKGDKHLTLVGTMHIGIKAEDMDPLLWQRLNEADTVIIETDLSTDRSALMAQYMTLPVGQDLSLLLGERHWLKLLSVLKEARLPLSPEQLKRMSPMAAGALLLQVQTQDDQEEEARSTSIDSVIFERGRSLGKTLRTLETNEEQLQSLQKVFHIETIQKALDDWETEAKDYAELKKAFKEGNAVALDDLLKEVPEDMRHVLLEQRNQNWIKKLPTLQGQKTLMAVGAAHFAGDWGLLRLLAKEGYSIKRVR
jgi:uncharacterized protein YbaP (TraB family)